MTELPKCHDCHVAPGELHVPGCDVEVCPDCGGQWIACGCPNPAKHPRLPWTGRWPKDETAIENGWLKPDGSPDVNKVNAMTCAWDAARGKWVSFKHRREGK